MRVINFHVCSHSIHVESMAVVDGTLEYSVNACYHSCNTCWPAYLAYLHKALLSKGVTFTQRLHFRPDRHNSDPDKESSGRDHSDPGLALRVRR